MTDFDQGLKPLIVFELQVSFGTLKEVFGNPATRDGFMLVPYATLLTRLLQSSGAGTAPQRGNPN